LTTLLNNFQNLDPEQFALAMLDATISQLGVPTFANVMDSANAALQNSISQLENQMLSLILQGTSEHAEEIQGIFNAIEQIRATVSVANGLMQSQNNISLCKTASSRIGGFQ
jgi:hypothetical protein